MLSTSFDHELSPGDIFIITQVAFFDHPMHWHRNYVVLNNKIDLQLVPSFQMVKH